MFIFSVARTAGFSPGFEHSLCTGNPTIPSTHLEDQLAADEETLIQQAGLNATFLRPWYVLGPGHRWPYVLMPAYAVLARIPATRDGALRLGLVRHGQMLDALVDAVEHPPVGTRVVDVPAIRAGRSADPTA